MKNQKLKEAIELSTIALKNCTRKRTGSPYLCIQKTMRKINLKTKKLT